MSVCVLSISKCQDKSSTVQHIDFNSCKEGYNPNFYSNNSHIRFLCEENSDE